MKKLKFAVVGMLTGLMAASGLGASTALAAAHGPGTNIVSNGTIYMITSNGQRRPYTSAGAYLSYGFNSWANAVPANSEDMALPEGAFIPPRDGKIVCSDRGADKGTCYLITNSKRAAFTSAGVFTGLGFSFAKALYGDVSFLEQDQNISSSAEQHRPGVLINKAGTVYLVASQGLMGIPSMDVLGTWGYSLTDVVMANAADNNLSQTSVISARQNAALSPIGGGTEVSEESLIQAYIDTHPDLPTVAINAPEDGAAAIDVVKKIESTPGNTLNPLYPYLSSQTIEMFTKIPAFKQYWESPSPYTVGMIQENSNVQVFQGGTVALYTQSKRQTATNFGRQYYWVMQKENGQWKWDLIGTLKYQDKLRAQQNPSGQYVTGSGSSNISLEEAEYTDNPKVNDAETVLLVAIKNNGQTTVKKFNLLVNINGALTVDETLGYELMPGQAVVLAVPIDRYWQLSGTNKAPGLYATTATVAFDTATSESNQNDNVKTLSTNFQAKVSSPF